MALLIRYNLEAVGFHVHWIDDGAAAFDELLRLKPDVVLLDWSLPRLAGIQILRKIRVSPALCTLPVLMVTGRSGSKDRARAIGADDFLVKPVAMTAIVGRLTQLMDRSTSGIHRARQRLSILSDLGD